MLSGTEHIALYTLLVVRAKVSRSEPAFRLELMASLWGRCGRETYSKPSKSEEENSCHQQKRKWLEWGQPQSLMNSFFLQALFPSPHKGKTKQGTCTLSHNWRGKQSHRRLLRWPWVYFMVFSYTDFTHSGLFEWQRALAFFWLVGFWIHWS